MRHRLFNLLRLLSAVAAAGACLACSEQGLGRDPVQFAGKVAEGSFDPPTRWLAPVEVQHAPRHP